MYIRTMIHVESLLNQFFAKGACGTHNKYYSQNLKTKYSRKYLSSILQFVQLFETKMMKYDEIPLKILKSAARKTWNSTVYRMGS